MSRELSSADLRLLDAAVRRVAQFTCEFAKQFWGVSVIAARRRLQKLERVGLVEGRNVLVSQPPPVSKPLCIWKPGIATPHSGQVSYLARQRWKTQPVVVNRIYNATDLGRGLLGCSPIKSPKDIQATHDLGLADLYLHYLRRWPKLTAKCWLNESEYAHLRGRCVKVEDAMLRRGDRTLLMIDYAGAYRPDRVEALLMHAQLHHVPIAIY